MFLLHLCIASAETWVGVSAHPSNLALHLSSHTGSPPVTIPAQGDRAGVRTVGSQWQAKDGGRNKLCEIAFPSSVEGWRGQRPRWREGPWWPNCLLTAQGPSRSWNTDPCQPAEGPPCPHLPGNRTFPPLVICWVVPSIEYTSI